MRLVFALFLFSLSLHAQDLNRYFDETKLTAGDPYEYDEVNFNWNMDQSVQVLLHDGLNFLREGNHVLALSKLNEVVRMDSSLWMAYYYRAIANHQLQNFRAAILDIAKSISLNDKIAESHGKMGDFFLQQANRAQAEQAYLRSVKLDRNYAAGYFKLGNLSLQMHDDQQALKYYEKALKVNSLYADVYTNIGITKFWTNKPEEAYEYFNEAIKVGSGNSLGYFWRGLILASSNQYDQTLNDWSYAIAHSPSNLFYVKMRAYLNIELRRHDDAFRDFSTLIVSQPTEKVNSKFQTYFDKLTDVHLALNYCINNMYRLKEETMPVIRQVGCALLSGNNEESLVKLKRAQAIEASATVYFLKAVTFENLKNHDSAFYFYSKSLELDNDNFEAHRKRAIYRSQLNDWKGAYIDLNQMLRIQPNSQVALKLSGLIKAGLKDYYGAMLDITRFLKKDTTDFDMWKTRAICKYRVKDFRGAIVDYRRSLTIQPQQEEIYSAISECHYQMGDTVASIGVLKETLKFSSPDPAMLLAIADLLMATKKLDSAEHYLKPLLTRGKNVGYFYSTSLADANYLMAKIYFKRKNVLQGIKSLDECLRYASDHIAGRYLRAQTYVSQGEISKAKKDLKILKDLNYGPAKRLLEELDQN